ncbi:MAG: DUF1028 domain-containing protein [Bacteroidia bacterium]|nr:DUF1028 domain-containing protein [Bacteroidia bacterium]
MRIILIILCLCFCCGKIKSQDTFSILAFDSITGEVGAAGASCVDLFPLPQFSNHFITELFPGEGAIATQASYLPANQVNARNQFMAGDSPTQIISWLQANDDTNDPSVRQYGVVRMNTGYPQTAAHTGSNCMNYKNHIIGPNYTIHGNILLGQKVLDSMESRFNREKGDLACKLMAALQGAKMVGADTRCASNNSSSLFAFLKVAQPTDTFGQNSFLLSLKTHNNDSIEPIDSLQTLFSAVRSCTFSTVGIEPNMQRENRVQMYPNPGQNSIWFRSFSEELIKCSISDISGREIMQFEFRESTRIESSTMKQGVYFVHFLYSTGNQAKRLLISR